MHLKLSFEIEGIYSPNAYRGFAREFIKDLERIRFQTHIPLLAKILSLLISGKDSVPRDFSH